MTPQEIQAMPAGHEMDALVAEKVMGWERRGNSPYWWWSTDRNARNTSYGVGYLHPEGRDYDFDRFEPCSEIAHAWAVVEHILNTRDPMAPNAMDSPLAWLGFRIEFHTEHSEEQWVVQFPMVTCAPPYEEMDPEFVQAKAEAAPLAICRAALMAVTT
jgi:hypothetical protein